MGEVILLFVIFTILAILVEFLVERIKNLVQINEVGKIKLVPFYSIAVGLGIAFVIQVDFVAYLGKWLAELVGENPLHTIPVVGYIITGLIISAGSAPVHELFAKLKESRITNQDGTNAE